MTPFEAWHVFKPKVDFFKIFGYIAYAYIPSQKREKSDENGDKYIFVAYSDKSKAYRLIDPRTNKLVISGDVIFYEFKVWRWENEQGELPRFFDEPETSNLEETLLPQSPISRAKRPIPSARTSDPSSPDSTPRLNTRTRLLADIHESCDLALSALEPKEFEEAVKEKIWQDAMEEEIIVIKKNSTWEIVGRPKSKDIIGLKWIYNWWHYFTLLFFLKKRDNLWQTTIIHSFRRPGRLRKAFQPPPGHKSGFQAISRF